MSIVGRPLAARTGSNDPPKVDAGSSAQDPSQNPNPGGRAKRTLIESACAACRKRKSRCDGVRPKCTRCQSLRTDCVYEAEEGESRWSALKRRNQSLKTERDELREVVSMLQSIPEADALEVFRRIRDSRPEDLQATVRQIRNGNVASRVPGMPDGYGAAGDQRLPPIQTLVDVSGRAPGAGRTNRLPSISSDGGSTASHSSGRSATAFSPVTSQAPST